MKTLLLFHGSTENLETLSSTFKRKISNLTERSFEVCFLKGNPDFCEALNQALQEKETEITVIPLFMLPGAHLKKDIPDIINNFRKNNPEINITLENCLVSDDNFIKYLAKRIK